MSVTEDELIAFVSGRCLGGFGDGCLKVLEVGVWGVCGWVFEKFVSGCWGGFRGGCLRGL